VGVNQAPDGGCLDQRGVTTQYHNILGAGWDLRDGTHDRMACAKLFRLYGKAKVWIRCQGIPHCPGLVANDHHDVPHSIEGGLNHIANHGHAGYFVEYLGFVGMHAGPLSRSEYDGTNILHEEILAKKKGQVN
jgi:hypothetical protein